MRRLDGFGSETNRYTQIGNGAKLDDKGQERRTKISEIMEKEEGTTPPVIKTLYNKYQTLDSKNHLNGFEQDTSQSSKYYVDQMLTGENKTKLENYANRSLADRYRNVCNLAGFLYALFRNDSNIKAIIDTNQMLLAGNRCTTLIQTRINAETTYIETVAIQKSTQALTDTVKEFANTYLNKRLADLQTLIQQSKTSRARVVKAVPKLIPICS
ncbi:MAG: hypothetical protein LBU27_05605 [Candidatus Peribacteria bacterium]|jgi:hypothetical protein|nr:hypothetical protein [Candidatus Peribacteria bacterium]